MTSLTNGISVEHVTEQEKLDMKPDQEEILRQKQMAFIGKMLDDLTQRTRNHLGTIQESVERLGDVLRQADRCTEEDREKYAGILSSIERNVKILARKNQHLNRFAQRTGTAFSTFDPKELVEEAMSFSTRFARLREVTIKHEVAETLPSLYSDPGRIYFLVSILINDMLERVTRGGKIILRAGSVEKGVLIEIEGYGTFESAATSTEKGNRYWSIGEHVVVDLGGHLKTTETAHDMQRTSLFLPVKQAPNVSPISHLSY